MLSECQNPKNELIDSNELKYLTVFRNGRQTDTLTKKIINITFSDSVYNLTHVTELDTLNYRLPIGNLTQEYDELGFNLIGKKSFYYEGDDMIDHIIYKFLFDDPNANDEEILLFFSPEYGILIDKAAWWGNYYKLIDTGNPNHTDELFFLTEMIMFDSDFFHNWTAANKP